LQFKFLLTFELVHMSILKTLPSKLLLLDLYFTLINVMKRWM